MILNAGSCKVCAEGSWRALNDALIPSIQRFDFCVSWKFFVIERPREARARGAVGVWLDTFSFQHRPFYEARGYELFGEIADHPRGERRYFLKKLL